MRTPIPTCLLLAAAVAMSACWSTSVKSPPKEPDPFAGTTADPESAAARNRPPPPKNQTEPDMEFLKDMAQRSVRQAKKCDVPENAGPRGVANVSVQFVPIGRSGDVTVQNPHAKYPIGDCIKRAFEGVIVTGWQGEPVVIEEKVDFGEKTAAPK